MISFFFFQEPEFMLHQNGFAIADTTESLPLFGAWASFSTTWSAAVKLEIILQLQTNIFSYKMVQLSWNKI